MPAATMALGGLAFAVVLGVGCGSSEAEDSASTGEGTDVASEGGSSGGVGSEGVDSEDVGAETVGSESPAFDVMTADGSAMLNVPAGALPVGVEPSDVTLTVVDKEDVFEGGDIDDVQSVVELEPDGLELLVPATYRFATAAGESSFLLHTSGSTGTIEALQPMFDDPVDDVVWGSVELTHFSEVTRVDPAGGFAWVVTRVPLSDTWVGTRTSTHLSIRINGTVDWRLARLDGEGYVVSADDDEWTVEGLFSNTSHLDPSVIQHAPRRGPTDQSRLSVKAAFTCALAGQPAALHFASVKLDLKIWSLSGSEPATSRPKDLFLKTAQHPKCLAMPEDALADLLDSTNAAASFVSGAIDISGFAAGFIGQGPQAKAVPGLSADPDPALSLDPELVEEMFGTDGLYGCGSTTDDFEVVCPATNETTPVDEDVLVYAIKLAQPFALDDPSRRYQYAVVLDSDDDEANNWQYQGEFVNDFFQGADRWIVAEWTAEGWTLTVSSVDASQAVTTISSTARAVIFEDSILFYISAADVSAERPGYRLTAYGDDGNYTPTDRGGDVSGELPTSLATTYDTLNVRR